MPSESNLLKQCDHSDLFNLSNLTNDNDILYLPDLWESTDKEDLKFLLTNINNIASPILKKELLSILDTNSIPPSNFKKNEFDNLIIKSLGNVLWQIY